jgi:hypothetical protein
METEKIELVNIANLIEAKALTPLVYQTNLNFYIIIKEKITTKYK